MSRDSMLSPVLCTLKKGVRSFSGFTTCGRLTLFSLRRASRRSTRRTPDHLRTDHPAKISLENQRRGVLTNRVRLW